jgi:ferredoxin
LRANDEFGSWSAHGLSTEVYFFSASGNSLCIARSIAQKIGGQLKPMSSTMNKDTVELNSEVVGIVFPVYYATNDCGIPLIVSRFVKKLQNIGSKYIFAVCTCGYMPGSTIENLRKAITSQGGELACGFTVKMSSKSLSSKKQRSLSAKQENKLNLICEYVAAGKKGKFETRNALSKVAFAPLLYLAIKPAFYRRYRKLSGVKAHVPFLELVPSADKCFQVNENCDGCGTCTKVCPVNNIRLIEHRPVWQHCCETCYACFAWCPKGAIGGEIVAYNERYHNPEAKLSDMLAN